MINKLILIFIFYALLLSCGKKENPEYKANKKNILISKV